MFMKFDYVPAFLKLNEAVCEVELLMAAVGFMVQCHDFGVPDATPLAIIVSVTQP